jgi:hypothetical protein
MKPPRIQFLGTVAGLSIYLVSGERVRDEIDIDFTMGGNEAIYPSYIPAGEIWIDDAAHALDRNATALHEIVERDQMIRFHKDYDAAHDVASATERPFRQAMLRDRPRGFSAPRVAAAYQSYLKEPNRHPIVPRPNEVKRAKQLDAEIRAVVSRRGR